MRNEEAQAVVNERRQEGGGSVDHHRSDRPLKNAGFGVTALVFHHGDPDNQPNDTRPAQET